MKVPDSVAGEYEKVKQGIYDEIEKLNLEKDKFKSEKNNLPTKFYNLMQGIAKNCTQIVQAYTELNPDFKAGKAKVFYRGIKSSEDAVYGKPFDERRVMTSSSELSNIFNNRMKEAGFEARRDNSSFVSADKNQASGYGKLYVMFPKDGFSFSWSRNTKDLILDRGSYSKMIDYDKVIPLKDAILTNKDKLNSYEYDFSFSDLLGEWNLDGTLKSAKKAIDNGILSKDLEPLTELENIITPESLTKGFELDQEDLTGAIESEREVYVRGAYYAVAESYLKEIMKFLELKVYPEGKPKVIKPGEYEIGDRVTVKAKSSSYYGQSGEITYVYANWGDATVQLDGSNWTQDFKYKDLKHESEESSHEFAEGERVEVTDQDNEYFGKQGKITFVYSSGKLEVSLPDGAYSDFQPNQVKLIDDKESEKAQEPTAKIEVGDEVEITGGQHKGHVGKISYVWTVSDNVDVIIPDLNNAEVSVEKEFVKKVVNPTANEPTANELKIGDVKTGDKVKIIGGIVNGESGTVVYAYSTQPKVDIEVEDGMIAYDVLLKDIEKVNSGEETPPDVDLNIDNLKWEPEPEVQASTTAKLSPGDKVKITGNHYGGHTGVVDTVNTTGTVVVKLDTTGSTAMFYANELSKIENTPEPEVDEKPDLQVGMQVKIVGNHPDAGKTGKLIHVSSYFDDATVSPPGGIHIYDVPLKNIKPISDEPAAQAPAQPEINIEDFTVGKPVKITKGENAGKVGTIDYVSKVLANADILTPHGPMINNVPLTDLQVLNSKAKTATPAVPLKDTPEVQKLIKSAAASNSVTYSQIDSAIPNGATSDDIESLLNYLAEIGMDVVDDA